MPSPEEPAADPGELLAAGGAAYVDDRFDEARALWEQAFRLLQGLGALPAAARVATLLGELHWGGLGHPSIGRGWLERARRLLDEAGPCVERGYWELARLACDRPDVVALQESADRALELGATYRDPALQMRALADGGFARVCQGRLAEGFARLEEAAAMLTSGEVTDPFAVSTTWCALLSACDRAGDAERAREWLDAVRTGVLAPSDGRPRMLGAHCQIALGGVLCAVGRWQDAEETIREALDSGSGATAAHRQLAAARLAELKVESGRVDEAAEIVARVADTEVATWPLALVHVARDEPALAAAALRRGLEAVPGDVLRQAQWLDLLVTAEVGAGDLDAAHAAVERLGRLAEGSDSGLVAAYAAQAAARLALAHGRGAEAAERMAAAEAGFAASDRPLLVAQTRLSRAETLGDDRPEDAVAAARAAYATGVRLEVPALRDASAALLRRLGAPPPRPVGAAVGLLTAREAEVLDRVRRGDSNAEIGARLFLSPKTVEHHVTRILAKLHVRTRAEAAAVTAAGTTAP